MIPFSIQNIHITKPTTGYNLDYEGQSIKFIEED